MQNTINHSAEGSSWTKKNHKYIRKEGNRYIYPEDLKKISKQHSNRMAAANGKVVNPEYVIRGSDGKVLGRGNTNKNYSLPNTSEYKRYGQLRAGEANRSNAMNKQGSNSGSEYAKKITNFQATKRAYKESNGKPLTKIDVYSNGAYNADRKKTTVRVTPAAPGTNSPQQLAKYTTAKNKRTEAAGNVPKSHYSQEEAKTKTDDRRREGKMSPRNIHRPGSAELHDDKGFKKDQNQYYDKNGVRRSTSKYDTKYDDKGVRKYHSSLKYEKEEQPDKSKSLLDRPKEALAEHKWNKEKASIKKENTKELKQRQKNAEKLAKEQAKREAKEKKEREKEIDKSLPADMRRKRNIKRGKKAVQKFFDRFKKS